MLLAHRVHTIFYTAWPWALKFVFGLGMALVLNQERLLNNLFRSFPAHPLAIPMVISALNWRWIYDDASGSSTTYSWRLELIEEPSPGSPTLISPCLGHRGVVWQGDGPFLPWAFLAGLQAIPKELYEAAEIDGPRCCSNSATSTIPSLRPISSRVMLSRS